MATLIDRTSGQTQEVPDDRVQDILVNFGWADLGWELLTDPPDPFEDDSDPYAPVFIWIQGPDGEIIRIELSPGMTAAGILNGMPGWNLVAGPSEDPNFSSESGPTGPGETTAEQIDAEIEAGLVGQQPTPTPTPTPAPTPTPTHPGAALPELGQSFQDENGNWWVWDGEYWDNVGPTHPGAATDPGQLTGGLPPPFDESNFLEQNAMFQAIFEQTMGIPDVGRSPYEQWLAKQWQVPASEYLLRGEGIGAEPIPQTFQDYMAARAGQPVSVMGGDYLNQLSALSPGDQRVLFNAPGGDTGAILPDFVREQAFLSGLQQQYPSFIAAGKAQQAFSQPVQREWMTSPEAIAGGSFLDYLRNRFNIR